MVLVVKLKFYSCQTSVKLKSVSIHRRDLQVLATEMFKIHGGLSLEILRETFVSKTSSYNLRRNDTFEKHKVHSVYHGTESLSFLGPKIRDLVLVELKQSETLYSFKLKIRKNVHTTSRISLRQYDHLCSLLLLLSFLWFTLLVLYFHSININTYVSIGMYMCACKYIWIYIGICMCVCVSIYVYL